MTLRNFRERAGEVKPFNGTDAERAENRLSHAWVQVPNPMKAMPLPKSWVKQLSKEEAYELAKPKLETWGKCSVCGCWFNEEEASWKCGEAPRFTESKF